MGPRALASALGQKHPPTDQQAEVIGAAPGPLLVVAGAGAGKTETMAARVVWLVANGYARPEEILGLTFTRKAAQELGKRIRDRLKLLAADDALVRRLDPSGGLADALTVIAPTVSTYDAYAGDLVREYGLLVPVEPDARLITNAELHAIATDVVSNYTGTLLADGSKNPALATAVDNVLGLITSMGNELADPDLVSQQADIFLKETEALAKRKGSKGEYPKELQTWRAKQAERVAYLPSPRRCRLSCVTAA
ncbi:UvrD-helicase domain-containing protein [Corynebacterium aquatimens]|nr:UvrD-helicase domain-containing protein [Corynebacterium aquatimens]